MSKIINVKVEENKDKAYIVFQFDEEIKIEITSDDQDNTKDMFYKILEAFIENEDISFCFNKENDNLYSEVAEKYINNLNSELESLKEDYCNPLNS